MAKIEKSICPYCGHEHNVKLGIVNHQYKVNDSKGEYVECECPSCEEKYWHSCNNETGNLEKHEDDKLVLGSITCWF